MAVSVFDIFKIGIGPSSSHTVGPMRAAKQFTTLLEDKNLVRDVKRVRSEMYGSLGATGRGHATDTAVILGLAGYEPDTVNIDDIPNIVEKIRTDKVIELGDQHKVGFAEDQDLILNGFKTLPYHANGMQFSAYDAIGNILLSKVYYSVGGGFVLSDDAVAASSSIPEDANNREVLPLPFHSGEELLQVTKKLNCSIAEIVLRNETYWRSVEQTRAGIMAIWRAMQACVERGCRTEGTLPGGFRVRRRAATLAKKLESAPKASSDFLTVMDWVNVFALAVNEENASGGRVVTAPTNGAAGIIPAVLHYYVRFIPNATEDGVVTFFLTASAIGMLYKENASISGAEVGCQGEVGVACSMAAAGLCAVLGGTPEQIENAAEIGMEHHLGMTCDPVGGLVQIPCIERNAIASTKAINAARMALNGDGTHHVSLDQVIKTMRETGADMLTKYKETSRGGLAVNIVEC